MNSGEPSALLYTRLSTLDPDSASKIMGFILIHGPNEADMMSLATAPDAVLQNLICKGKNYSRVLAGNASSLHSPTACPSPRLSAPSPRFPQNGFVSQGSNTNSNLSSPRPIPTAGANSISSGGGNGGSSKASPSYAAVVNGNGSSSGGPTFASSFPSSTHFHHNDGEGELTEDGYTVPEALSFLNERSKSDDLYDLGVTSPRSFHKRSLSLSDAYGGAFSSSGSGVGGGADEMSSGGVGWRPCMYFARGFCRNGSSCKFLHSGFVGDDDCGVDVDDVVAANLASSGKYDGFEHELLRSRAAQQQQRLALASQIMSGGSFPYNKFFTDSPRSKAAAMMMGEELQKLGMMRHERGDFGMMGCGSGSRQIYLTFPADSTFREEDVSNYFSIYGPVQDVRIPYQQKRMFGFVTFVHPETVKIILAKGNPHFVCDSRVLVKPYKEKGKVEKKHLLTQQQLERGDLSSCSSPHGVDIRDFDVPIGPRMFYNNTQDLLMRRKLEEQAELQQALEMQSRKMASLQLLDMKNLSRRHPFSPNHNLSNAAAISSPTHHPLLSPNHMRSMGAFNQDAFEENITAPTLSLPPHALGNRQTSMEGYSNVNNCNDYIANSRNESRKLADSGDNESIDLVLPETLDDTATPTRQAASSRQPFFSSSMLSMTDNAAASSSPFSSNSGNIGSSACLSNAALPKSRFLDDPSFGSGSNRAIEM